MSLVDCYSHCISTTTFESPVDCYSQCKSIPFTGPFQSCYVEGENIVYPPYFKQGGNLIPIFAFFNATQIFNLLVANNNNWNVYLFMPGVYWLNQSLTDLGNGNMYLYSCQGAEIRGARVGHFQLFYWRAASNIVVDGFYLNCLYINATINFGMDFTSGNQNVTMKNNRFYSMWEGDSVYGQGSSGLGMSGVHNCWILNNTFVSTIQLSAGASGCNGCNYSTFSHNTIINYSSGYQMTGYSNYGFNTTMEYNNLLANQPIKTGFTTDFSVGLSVFGTQLYTIIRYNNISGYAYDIDGAGNTPGWDPASKICQPYNNGTNSNYNPYCLQFMNCISCGPIVHFNILSDYANGIELGTIYTSFQFNTLIIAKPISFAPGYSTPITYGCGSNSVVQNNVFIFATSVGFPFRIITTDGVNPNPITGVNTGYCCANIEYESACAQNPGFIVGMNYYGNGNGTLWKQWGVVSPDSGVSPCCISNSDSCAGFCNPQTGNLGFPAWNTTWNFAGYPNTNINLLEDKVAEY